MNVSFCLLANNSMSMFGNPSKKVAYELILTFTTVSCSSYLDCLGDGSKWPYSYYFVGCCFYDLFKIVYNILISPHLTFLNISCIIIWPLATIPIYTLSSNNDNLKIIMCLHTWLQVLLSYTNNFQIVPFEPSIGL